MLIPPSAEIGIFPVNLVNTISTGAPIPSVARSSSATTVLTVYRLNGILSSTRREFNNPHHLKVQKW